MSLPPIQENEGKRVKELDYWRVCEENKHLAKKNSQLKMSVRKLVEERDEADHRTDKARLVVIDLVSRFEVIKKKVEETAEIRELVKDLEVKLNIKGVENVNIHKNVNTHKKVNTHKNFNTHENAILHPDDENKENQDPFLPPFKGTKQIPKQHINYIPRIADCSVYGFDD